MRKILYLAALLIAAAACAGNETRKSDESRDSVVINTDSLAFPMPVVPDSISSREGKLRYVALHYWDSMDFNDTTRSLRDDIMEQNFSNFTLILSSLSEAGGDGVDEAFSTLLTHASVNPRVLGKVRDIARLYLAEPDSPMRDDALWVVFIDAVLRGGYADEALSLRLANERERAVKNMPGTKAADFEYVTADGKKSRLSATPAGTESLMVFFYDPTCEACEETLSKMKNDASITDAVKGGRMKILAVAAKGTKPEWEAALWKFPDDWTVGFNTDGIDQREVYAFPSLPSIYILSPDLTVVAKDINY